MYADAIRNPGQRRCGRGETGGFGSFLHAMSGGYGRRGRHRSYGSAGGWGFPFGSFAGGGGPFGRSRKARRGDIRTAALLLLAEEPRNGYQIMQEVEQRSEGVWRPSPGSVYPALAQLEDEGLIGSEEIDGRKLFVITDAGRNALEDRPADAPAPWEQMGGDISDEAVELGKLVREVAYAFTQIVRTGSPSQLAKAKDVLVGARRDLYRILANGDEGASVRQDV